MAPLMKNEGFWSLREDKAQMFLSLYKTGRSGGMPDGCAAVQRDLRRLKKWANKCSPVPREA